MLQPHLTLTQVEAFARQYVVRGRILNALGRLHDAGLAVTNSMADMAALAPAIVADLHKECAPEWQALVAQGCSDKRIRGMVGKTLAAVYHRMLLEGLEAGHSPGGSTCEPPPRPTAATPREVR